MRGGILLVYGGQVVPNLISDNNPAADDLTIKDNRSTEFVMLAGLRVLYITKLVIGGF